MFNEYLEYRHRTKTTRLVMLGILVHTMIFVGVVDIYFSSPVQHGLPSYNAHNVSLAKRVIIYVADGLRAEGIFSQQNANYTPFLTHIKDNVGAWGVCHTQVPTESRPGHVAMFAGMYEDPNAVMKGWKRNPLDFDHVFNQSKFSWLWGSPDVILMFDEDASHIYSYAYESSFQDFSGQQSTILLDEWVFERVKEFFHTRTAEECHNCQYMILPRTIYFLHLLGMDTAGHVHKPNSEKYIDNLKFVDGGIKDMTQRLDTFFGDNKSTYIFTSDHGMTDWGSHGSGSNHETEIPFIIWGGRVHQNSRQQDLEQADIATIISALLGSNNPINSVGVFQEKYFDMSDEELAMILLANARTLGEQFKAHQIRMERNLLGIFYKPYKHLPPRRFVKFFENIQRYINADKYKDAISDAKTLIALIKEAKAYNNEYLTMPMLIIFAIGLGMFMVYLAALIPNSNTYVVSEELIYTICGRLLAVFVLVVFFLIAKGVQLKFVVYISLPVIMLFAFIYEINQLINLYKFICNYNALKLFLTVVIIFTGVECLSLSFFNRDYIIYAMAAVILWIFLGKMTYVHKIDKLICSAMAVYMMFFPLFETFKQPTVVSYGIGAVMILYIAIVQLSDAITSNGHNRRHTYFCCLVYYIKIACLVVGCFNVLWVMIYEQSSSKMMIYIYVSSWIILVLSLVTMTFHPRYIMQRTYGILVSLYTIYFMMSNKGEPLFMAVFLYMCIGWVYMEMRKFDDQPNQKHRHFDTDDYYNADVELDDFRRCFFFMTLVLLSFFGSGNMVDLNTFDPMWTKCFVQLFRPFLITSLIGIKLLIPFLIVTVAFHAIHVYGRLVTLNSFSIILLYSDVMVMNMMFNVTNRGSWLEIGMSLSRFVIVMVITIALLLLYGISKKLTSNLLFDQISPYYYKFLRNYFALDQEPIPKKKERITVIIAGRHRRRLGQRF